MAQIKEIVESELNRTGIEQLRQVRLFREGSFLRAYEWSAWLCCKFIGELKVTKRQIKGIEQPVAYVGFPLTSIDKYTPKGAQIVPEADGSVMICLPSDAIADDVDQQTLVVEYDQWKQDAPLTERYKDKKDERHNEMSGKEIPFDIHQNGASVGYLLHRILSYPLEMRTPVDNLQFISELKQMASSIV